MSDIMLCSGKAFDTSCPLGPVIVSPDEFDAHNAKIRCLLNGETVQDSSTSQLIFKTEYLIHWISKFCTLTPGDIILTGTVYYITPYTSVVCHHSLDALQPPGVGCFRKPPLWLKASSPMHEQ